VHAASIQDRDGAGPLLQASRGLFPFIERVFADTAYAAERVANATRIVVEIVRKLPEQVGFVVLPRRWVVDRRTTLPVWALNGPGLLNVRAVGGRFLFPGSSGERVDLS
jgi:hypothetical protein